MDNRFDVRDAMNIANDAANETRLDFAMSVIRSLIQGQFYLNSNWCQVWRGYENVIRRFPASQRNLKRRAFYVINRYMSLYRDDCP
jgi:hypothetical protein